MVRRLKDELDLLTFFTAGDKETRAWTLRKGQTVAWARANGELKNVKITELLAEVDQWTGLGDGYQVDTRITVFTQDDVAIVPAGALLQDRSGRIWAGGKSGLYLVTDRRTPYSSDSPTSGWLTPHGRG